MHSTEFQVYVYMKNDANNVVVKHTSDMGEELYQNILKMILAGEKPKIVDYEPKVHSTESWYICNIEKVSDDHIKSIVHLIDGSGEMTCLIEDLPLSLYISILNYLQTHKTCHIGHLFSRGLNLTKTYMITKLYCIDKNIMRHAL